MRPGMGPEQDLETVRLMREAVGPDFDLMVDAHTWWRMGDRNYARETVDRLAEQLAEYNIAWLEEPLPPDDHEAYLQLKELILCRLASGEHEPTKTRYLDLILTESVDYVQMDVVCQGGYPMARRLFPAIGRAGLKFAFHSWGTALEVMAAAHLGICWPESVVEWLEYPCYSTPSRAGMYPFPLAAEILKTPLEIDHGDLIVPKGPGLGVEIDEDVSRALSLDSGSVVVFQTGFAADHARGHRGSQRAVVWERSAVTHRIRWPRPRSASAGVLAYAVRGRSSSMLGALGVSRSSRPAGRSR